MTEQELMLTHLLDCRRVDLVVDPPALSDAQTSQLRHMESRRGKGEPLQYILGECEFMGLTLKVDPRVLIPRPETEMLVEAALAKLKQLKSKNLKILDIGSGSGNIAICLAKNLLGCEITSVDISPPALEMAAANALKHEVNDRITFLKSDVFEGLRERSSILDQFDMIVSNPPYVPAPRLSDLPLEVQKEPMLALDGGADGLDFYRRIIPESIFYLKPGGYLVLEIGEEQGPAIQEIFERSSRFVNVHCQKDYSHKDRIMTAELK